MAGKSKDFDASELVKTSQDHEQQLKELSNRVDALESRVGDSESFGKTFANAQKTEKTIDAAIEVVIDKHDNHKLKINGLAIAKWTVFAILSALIGAGVQKSLAPSTDLQPLIEAIQNQSGSSK